MDGGGLMDGWEKGGGGGGVRCRWVSRGGEKKGYVDGF